MKQLLLFTFWILLVVLCPSCNEKADTMVKEQDQLNIAIIDAQFPLKIKDLNFQKIKNPAHIDDKIEAKIKQVIRNYYEKEYVAEEKEYFLLNDSYIGTIRLQDVSNTMFLVVLRHCSGAINSLLLFYDNESKKFIGEVYHFNIHALYVDDDKKLAATNLKEKFLGNMPEIELVDCDKDGINEFKFTRLYHNGTANAIETTILKVYDNKIDTLQFQ